MPRRPDLPCANCGELMWRGSTSLPEGRATCRPCRSKRSVSLVVDRTKYANSCFDCANPCWGQRCRSCRNAMVRPGPDAEKRRALQTRRAERDRLAPGLPRKHRDALLSRWQRQGRSCYYCPSPCESIDHVVPLAIGGTNREGNLVPCCRPCNGSKNDSLLIEWKHKRRTRRARTEVDLSQVKPRGPRGPVDYSKRTCKVYFVVCDYCGVLESAKRRTDLCKTHRYYLPKVRLKPCATCGIDMRCKQGARLYCSKKCNPHVISGAEQRKRRRARGGVPSVSTG